MAVVELPARLLLDQGKLVRGVAVDLAGGGEDEGRLRAVAAGLLEQEQGGAGVDVEVGLRLAARPVVGGLARGVDHAADVPAVGGEDAGDRLPVPDVHVVMGVAGQGGLELPALPGRRGLAAEEDGPHVVVDAGDLEAVLREQPHRGRADQTRRAGDEGDVHWRFPGRRRRPIGTKAWEGPIR